MTDLGLLQVGEETTSYVADAADGADVERGMLCCFVERGGFANNGCRGDMVVDGRSGRNKLDAVGDGIVLVLEMFLYKYQNGYGQYKRRWSHLGSSVYHLY